MVREAVQELERALIPQQAQNGFLGLLAAFALALTVHNGSALPAPPNPATAPIKTSAATERWQINAVTPPAQSTPNSNVKFERVSIEQGLSQNSVHCILQDSRGFMWFGTWDGLNKYNGYSFTVYKHDPDDPNSLSHNVVRALYEDQDGTLWIGTNGGGLDRFDRETETFVHYQYDPNDPHSLSNDSVVSIQQDQSGALWVGTNKGLNKFDPETESFVRYQHDPNDPTSLSGNRFVSVYQDQAGTLWVGTSDGGLNKFDQETGGFIHYQYDPRYPYSLSNNDILSIYEDRDGVLWVGTGGGGLNRFERERDRFIRYQHRPNDPQSLAENVVWAIYEDRSGVLWIGTDSRGLSEFDRENDLFIHHQNNPLDPNSLSSNDVRAIYQDRSGVLWVGTGGGGLNKTFVGKRNFAHYQNDPNDLNSLNGNDVFPIYQDREGIIWIGTHGKGLDRFDRENDQFTHYQHDSDDPYSLSHDFVFSIYEDREGVLWIGTRGGGLDSFDRETGHFTNYRHNPKNHRSLSSNVVTSIYEDQSGTLWVGTGGRGLNKFNRETGHFVRYQHDPDNLNSLSHNAVRSIYEDQEGVLWIGTDDGLNRFGRNTGQFTRYQNDPADPNSLSNDWVLSIHQSRSGVLWIATYGGGLNKFDQETETFTHYREKDGLPNDSIYGILEDSRGCLWLSTNYGLSRFDPRTETFKNYDARDGLQSNEFNENSYFKNDDGEMFFGGVNGFNTFHPNYVRGNPYIPPVVLTSLTQSGEEVDLGQAIEEVREVTFVWPNNFFEFEIAALSYIQSEKNQYAYILEGFDEEWIYIGTRRFGKYTNLPGGTYTLRVKGSNNDGVWNKQGASVTITIVPPFWATWWFRGIIALTLVGGAIGGYRMRVRSIEIQNRELESQVEERTAELLRTNELLKREIAERRRAEDALAQQAAETAVAAERSRLARDLHDAVTQTLFSASLIAEALPNIWESDQEEGRQLLAEMRRLSRGALAEMRTLLLELRPAALVETSLGALLHQLTEAISGRKDMSITVTVDDHYQCPPDVHVALYRIAQEALNNVVKHAQASQVKVSLCCLPSAGRRTKVEKVELRVSDDGRGFDPDHIPPDRLGLNIIRERAQAVGAALEIESQPDQGTQIVVIWSQNG